MKQDDYIQANRDMWNETADVHERAKMETLLEAVKQPDFNIMDATEKRVFKQLELSGKAVAQLSCNNGRELISVKKAGAGKCVGFDISEKFIAQGKRLAEAGNAEVAFVCTNVYDIPTNYDEQFDIVYVTIGALGWLPDLDAYFKIVNRLLKPNGHYFLLEMHPILDMLDTKKGLELVHSYFRTEPFEDEAEPDYYDTNTIVEAKSYWFHHKLSDIIGGCLRNGLNLTEFHEYDRDISAVFAHLQELEVKPPLSYSLVAQKQH